MEPIGNKITDFDRFWEKVTCFAGVDFTVEPKRIEAHPVGHFVREDSSLKPIEYLMF
jgi:hypothetical protein